MNMTKQIWALLLLPFRISGILNRKPKIPYMDAMDQLKTGDIFLARGRANISRLIEFVTGSHWSHVGIIIRPSDLGVKLGDGVDNDRPLLWESTTHDDVPDFYDKKGKRGAMLIDLADRIESNLKSGDYKVFGFRYLNIERTSELMAAYKNFIIETHGQKTDFPEYKEMIIDVLRNRYLTTSAVVKTYYCSELAATTMQAVGLMPLHPSPKSYLPRDFSARGYAPFLKRTTLGPEVYIGAPHEDKRFLAIENRLNTATLVDEDADELEAV